VGSHQSEPQETRLDTILVLDFGGQYCHLIARRIREQGVYSEIVSCDLTAEDLSQMGNRLNVRGLILSGGPSSVYATDAPQLAPEILGLGLPLLGLCYGHQLLAQMMGGRVTTGGVREYGLAYVTIDQPKGILQGLSRRERVWMSHYDTVSSLTEDFEVLAHTENCPIAAFSHKNHPILGLQWHPEVIHTEHGTTMLRNFLFTICGCHADWKPVSLIDQAINEIQGTVGGGKAIIALSGGIDSSTAAIIASKALGENLRAVFVDHGCMRRGEPDFVERTFTDLGVNVVIMDAQARFFQSLAGVVDPEEKRRIIGNEFIKVFEDVAAETGSEYLIQGTIYPDRIESGIRKHSEKIKSHHNVAGLPTHLRFSAIIEPLRNLYKDEVREIARSLGVPETIITRQPFPGPGLAVRIMGEVTPDRVELLKQADGIVAEEVEKDEAVKDRLWQYFAVLTGTKSTGVKGDARAYGPVVALRAVTSREAMTANFARLPYDLLERISTRITNEIPQITRVVYDITSKPPATIEWE